MKSVSLTAYPRTLGRRGGSKKLRTAGRVPAVIYGRKKEPQKLEVTLKDIENLIHHSVSENLLIDLSVDGQKEANLLALVQEVQHHALSGKVLHIDLHEVSADEKVTITVPVETEGEAAGVKNSGGVLEHVLFKIKVRALPKDLPEFISVDVTNLNLGEAIHLGEIKLPEGVEAIGDKHLSVIAVAAPKTEAQEAAETAAAAAPGEVEAIKEKKPEGEAAAAPAGKAGAAPAGKAADKGAEKKAEKKK